MHGNLHLGLMHTLKSTLCSILWQIFGEVKDLVTSCIDGFNVTIIAYGQAGSGKTFTMEVANV